MTAAEESLAFAWVHKSWSLRRVSAFCWLPGLRNDVLFDAPHSRDVFGGDAERQPLLARLLVGEPEMHDPVPHDDVRRRDIDPVLAAMRATLAQMAEWQISGRI